MCEKENWLSIINTLRDLEKDGVWLYRGDTSKELMTGIERACSAWPDPKPNPITAERSLLRNFQRRYPAWSTKVPTPTDTLAWLTLMQHFGAPTRLLDFTYSPYIAAYFSLQKLLLSDKDDAYIFAFRNSCFRQVRKTLPSENERTALDRVANDHDGPSFEELFFRDPPLKFVYPVNSCTLNERLVQQQGVFLCPGDVSISFESNLQEIDGNKENNNFRMLTLNRSILTEGLYSLFRMNIDSATLFPGLQGYSESLQTRLSFLLELGL